MGLKVVAYLAGYSYNKNMLIHKIRGPFGSVCKSWSGSYPTSLPKATRTTMTLV